MAFSGPGGTYEVLNLLGDTPLEGSFNLLAPELGKSTQPMPFGSPTSMATSKSTSVGETQG